MRSPVIPARSSQPSRGTAVPGRPQPYPAVPWPCPAIELCVSRPRHHIEIRNETPAALSTQYMMVRRTLRVRAQHHQLDCPLTSLDCLRLPSVASGCLRLPLSASYCLLLTSRCPDHGAVFRKRGSPTPCKSGRARPLGQSNTQSISQSRAIKANQPINLPIITCSLGSPQTPGRATKGNQG
jgi:hypothetical protein